MINTELYDDFDLSLDPDRALALCYRAVADLGWKVVDEGDDFVRGKEEFAFVSFTWPAEVQAVVEPNDAGGTTVFLDGKVFGLGPVQKGHLRKQMSAFRIRIELLATQERPAAPTAEDSLAVELERLAALRKQGVLTEDEFQQAKARLLG